MVKRQRTLPRGGDVIKVDVETSLTSGEEPTINVVCNIAGSLMPEAWSGIVQTICEEIAKELTTAVRSKKTTYEQTKAFTNKWHYLDTQLLDLQTRLRSERAGYFSMPTRSSTWPAADTMVTRTDQAVNVLLLFA